MPRTARNSRLLAKYVTASITVELHDALEVIAQQEHRRLAEIVRFALNEYVKNWEERNPRFEI